MKKILLTLVALAVVALVQPVQAAGVLAEIAKNAGQRQNFRQTKALNNQALRLGLVAPVQAYHYQAPLRFVAPVRASYYAQAQLVAPVYAPAIRERVVYAEPIRERIVYAPAVTERIVERVVAPAQAYTESTCQPQQQIQYRQQLNNGGCGQFFTQPYSR